MNSAPVDSETEDDPVWTHAMEFRLLTSKVIERVGPLWRAALVLSLSEQLVSLSDDIFIEGDVVSTFLSADRKFCCKCSNGLVLTRFFVVSYVLVYRSEKVKRKGGRESSTSTTALPRPFNSWV